MVCLAESLNICTRLFSFELAIPFTYQVTKSFLSCIKTVCCAIIVFTQHLLRFSWKQKSSSLQKPLLGEQEASSSFHFKKAEKDLVQFPGIINSHLISTESGEETTKARIDAIANTTLSMKLSKATNLEEERTIKSPTDADEEKGRMYHLLLPLFMLLVAFVCVLCLLTVLVC